MPVCSVEEVTAPTVEAKGVLSWHKLERKHASMYHLPLSLLVLFACRNKASILIVRLHFVFRANESATRASGHDLAIS